MRLIASVFLVAVLCSGCDKGVQAPAPAPDFKAPGQVIQVSAQADGLVQLSLSPVAGRPSYLVESTTTWRVIENGKEVPFRTVGQDAFFAAGCQARSLLVIRPGE